MNFLSQIASAFIVGFIGGAVPGPILTSAMAESLRVGFVKSLRVVLVGHGFGIVDRVVYSCGFIIVRCAARGFLCDFFYRGDNLGLVCRAHLENKKC